MNWDVAETSEGRTVWNSRSQECDASGTQGVASTRTISRLDRSACPNLRTIFGLVRPGAGQGVALQFKLSPSVGDGLLKTVNDPADQRATLRPRALQRAR